MLQALASDIHHWIYSAFGEILGIYSICDRLPIIQEARDWFLDPPAARNCLPTWRVDLVALLQSREVG